MQQQLSSAVRKSNRILMSLHSVVALEESFNLMHNTLRLVWFKLICSNVTAIVVVDFCL